MKKILGLDLGIASIGWAYVHEAEKDTERSSIVELGVRVNPLEKKEIEEFRKGKSFSPNQVRRMSRGKRLNLHRYKQRRNHLIEILLEHGLISKDTILHEHGKNTTFETLRLRAQAARDRVDTESLARVLLTINRKRGYKINRKIKDPSEGNIIDGMEIARELYEQELTPGQWLYDKLSEGGLKRLPDFYHSDIEQEFDRIWQFQKKNYPEVLTEELYKSLVQNKDGKKLTENSGVEPVTIKGTKQEKCLQICKWRAQALEVKLPLKELWVVLIDLKRALTKTHDYLGSISDRSKKLFFRGQTVGEYCYEQISQKPHESLKNQVFYRQDYLDEFERIWETQKKFHPQLTEELKAEIRDVIIFYQRKLKSQKKLIRICELEGQEKEVVKEIVCEGKKIEKRRKLQVGPRVCPRSSPLFQEFKIWQTLSNVKIFPTESNSKKEEGMPLSREDKKILFQELSIRESLDGKRALKILKISTKDWKINFEKLEGNRTYAALYKAFLQIIEMEGCHLESALKIKNEAWNMEKLTLPAVDIIALVESELERLGIDTRILRLDVSLEGKMFFQQPAYALWHLLYSYEGDNSVSGNDTLYRLLHEKFGFALEHGAFLEGVPLEKEYANLSTKAIKKLLPYMVEHTYSEACKQVGYMPSIFSMTREEMMQRPLRDHLELLPKGSLRQPLVERIINQLINLVNSLTDKYSSRDREGNITEVFHFDEIRIELARELKKSAEERKKMTDDIAKAENSNKKMAEEVQKIFNEYYPNLGASVTPSPSDIIRYRLYLELKVLGYKDIYRNRYIPKAKLFTPEIEIEHIIPRARICDNSFSNKTLAYSSDNKEKDNRTAFDYIEELHTDEKKAYILRVQQLESQKQISKAKAKKLLTSASEIEDGFIERDLRTTQYISKKAQEILLNISRSVVPTSGKITDYLRQEWRLIDLMKEMNLDKYSAKGKVVTLNRRNGNTVKVIENWSKRNDHRHHAMDALTVAFTQRRYIEYLNYLNVRYDEKNEELKDSPKNGPRFPLPMPSFREEARKHLELILVSHKAQNRVATHNNNGLTPRGALHQETLYGKRKRIQPQPYPLNHKFTMEQVALIADPQIREVVEEHIAHYPSISIALNKETLQEHPIVYQGEILHEVICFEEFFTQRIAITPDLKIDKVWDPVAREILRKRLEEFGGNGKKAFSDLDKNPICSYKIDEKNQKICMKRVRVRSPYTQLKPIRSKRTAEGIIIRNEKNETIPVDYVHPGENHHIAFYQDLEGNWHEYIVPFMEAMARVNVGLSPIDKAYNQDLGWQFQFSLKKNEMVVFPNPQGGFDPHEIDLLDPKNRALISPNLYRVQKLSSRYYVFRHHLETTIEVDLKDLTFKRITSFKDLQGCIKVRMNHLGEIVQIGEY